MPRIQLYIPDDLKARMDAVSDQVNWSPIARKAFEDELARIARRQEMSADLAGVVERLRTSKLGAAKDATEEGFVAGRAWAKGVAQYAELERLVNFDFSAGTPHAHAWQLVMHVLDLDETFTDLSARQEAYDTFWEGDVGVPTSDVANDQFLDAFLEVARDIWNQVADKL